MLKTFVSNMCIKQLAFYLKTILPCESNTANKKAENSEKTEFIF